MHLARNYQKKKHQIEVDLKKKSQGLWCISGYSKVEKSDETFEGGKKPQNKTLVTWTVLSPLL